MSTSPVAKGSAGCERCGSTLVRVRYMSMDGGFSVDHVDVYCGVCETFITHFNVSPYEEPVNVEG